MTIVSVRSAQPRLDGERVRPRERLEQRRGTELELGGDTRGLAIVVAHDAPQRRAGQQTVVGEAVPVQAHGRALRVDLHSLAGQRVVQRVEPVGPRIEQRQPERLAALDVVVQPAALSEQLGAVQRQRAADHARAGHERGRQARRRGRGRARRVRRPRTREPCARAASCHAWPTLDGWTTTAHQIGYLALPKGTPVHTSDGALLGTVARVLDNAREHIFDGIVVNTRDGRVFVDAPEVARITDAPRDADDRRRRGARPPRAPEACAAGPNPAPGAPAGAGRAGSAV